MAFGYTGQKEYDTASANEMIVNEYLELTDYVGQETSHLHFSFS